MNWFRGMGKGYGKKRQRCQSMKRHHQRRMGCLPLNEALENERYMILNNPDIKTTEMGLHAGSIITVHKNHQTDSNIIIAVGETRYIIPREIAVNIRVK
jgi:Fe2+ transport system protein FeoA